MKSAVSHQKKRILSVVSVVIALTVCLSLAQQAFGEAEIIGSWVTGISHTKESGSDRLLVVIAHGESNWWSSPSLSSVTYAGQTLTKVADIVEGSSWVTKAYVGVFILNEAGITAASGDAISASWSGTSSNSLTSVFIGNVEQSVPVTDYDTGSVTDASTVSTSSLSTNDGDIVIAGATCTESGAYTPNNGFTEAVESPISSADGCGAYKAATGASETPSVTHSTSSNRQALIGFVVQGLVIDPNKASHPNPGNGSSGILISAGLSWDAPTAYTPSSYDIYFGTDPNVYDNPKYTIDTNSYDPPGDLLFGTTYYWVVDSNDNGTIHPGFPWSFTTFKLSDRVAGNMILLNDNGGWCWYQDEKIAYDPVGGNILTSTTACYVGFGGVGGTRNDDTDATTFNIDTGKRTRVVAKEPYGGDDHNMGAFWIRPDGRYLHFYCEHYTDYTTYYRLSTYPNDGSVWNSEQSYNWMTIPGSPGVDEPNFYDSSYTNIVYLSGEGTPGVGRLYNIHRIFARTPCIAYSDDWGQNWTYMGRLNSPVGGQTYSNFYHKFANNGVDRIDFIGCENHPRDNNNNVYHGYIKNGKSYDSNGVEIDTINNQDAPSVQAFTPIFIADTTIDANSYHTGWTNELELDKDGYPVCLYQTRHGTEPWGWDSGSWGNIGAADHRFFYARFNGTEWTSTELCKMGGGLHLPEQDYLGMGCIHPNDANVVYVATQFDPRDDTEYEYREIFKGVTPDRGLTWNWTQITFDSTQNNTRPAIPKWDANDTAVVWTRGNWEQNNYERYDLVVVGIVDQKDVTLGKVTYIDADEINTKESDDTAFTPTGPSGSAGAADNQWHEYTGYGNGGSCYTAGDGGTEDAPTIKTTISGLADGTYDVFAYFWSDPEQDWGIRGGFESTDMLCFSKQSSQFAEASQFSGSVETVGSGVILYRVYIGREEVSEGSPIVVYLDNYDSTYNSNAPTRTTYDGVGVASVIIGGIPGDLNDDGKVNLIDFAILGQGWLTIYDMGTLADIADYWLFGT